MEKFSAKLILFLSVAALAACERSEFQAGLMTSEDAMDPSATRILMGSPTVADGVSALTVQVRLRNRKNRPLVGKHPRLAASGSGTTFVPCTPSNELGDSECWIRSTVAEVKTVWIEGLPGVSATAHFIAPRALQTLTSFVPFGDAQTAPAGHRFLTAAGAELRLEHKDTNNKARLRSSHLGAAYGME